MPDPFAVVVLRAAPLNVRTVPVHPCSGGVIVPEMLRPVGGFWQRFRTLVKKRAITNLHEDLPCTYYCHSMPVNAISSPRGCAIFAITPVPEHTRPALAALARSCLLSR